MRYVINTFRLFFIPLLFALGCGDPGSHYEHADKTYGNENNYEQSNNQNNQTNNSGNSSGAKPSPDAGGVVVINNQNTNDDPQPTDPSSLVLHSFYKAILDANSVLQLTDGKDPAPVNSLAVGAVKAKIVSDPADSIDLKQNFGDGVSKSQGEQTIINKAGDANVGANQPSQSGRQLYDRVVGSDKCPSSFVCIERMQFIPVTGSSSTYCFFDPQTNKLTAFPYSPASNYALADLTKAYGTYGPYRIDRYAGASVDCLHPTTAVEVSEIVNVKVSGSMLVTSPTMLAHTVNPLKPDLEMVIENTRANENKSRPYIDQTIRLQRKTRVQIDTTARQIVAMIKSVSSEVNIGAIGNFIGLNGVLVDLHLELCENRLNNPVQKYCN